MTVQGKGGVGKNQRKIGDTGRNPDRNMAGGRGLMEALRLGWGSG